MNLIDIMAGSCGEPESAHDIFVALTSYGKWILECSFTHNWSSLMKYHVKVCEKRFARDFHVDLWLDNFDGNAGTVLEKTRTPNNPPPS